MKLIRNAILSFAKTPDRVANAELRLGEVLVKTYPVRKNGILDSRVIIKAEIELPASEIELDDDGYVVVPTEQRVKCEQAIEALANTVSVFGRTWRSICSILPCVAFTDLSAEQRRVLDNSRGLKGRDRCIPGVEFDIDLTNPALLPTLVDRFGGVALLAEYLSAGHPLSKYRALVRFYEYAFALSFDKLGNNLAQFLAGNGQGYSHVEIRSWTSLRGGAVHGDRKKSKVLISESEVSPIIARMEQAAYDVLFNKDEWHTNSLERRDALKIRAGTTAPDSFDMMVVRGTGVKIHVQILDPYGSFLYDLDAAISSPPADWWWQPESSEEGE